MRWLVVLPIRYREAITKQRKTIVVVAVLAESSPTVWDRRRKEKSQNCKKN